MKIERTPVLCFFSLSLESLSVPLSVSPVLSNEAVVQLCDGLFAIFFFSSGDCRSGDAKGKGPKKRQFFFCCFCLFEINLIKVILEMLLKKGDWRP
uniref:Secreted protein n=1 Tax=Ixodes scapularis TaxID=6945 RepID=A0A4D5REA6_IXOSC